VTVVATFRPDLWAAAAVLLSMQSLSGSQKTTKFCCELPQLIRQLHIRASGFRIYR
jgi:hypothetical protein